MVEISALKHGPLLANSWEQMKYNFHVAFPGTWGKAHWEDGLTNLGILNSLLSIYNSHGKCRKGNTLPAPPKIGFVVFYLRIQEWSPYRDWHFDHANVDISLCITSPELYRRRKSEKRGHIQWSEFFGHSSVFCKSKQE